MKRTLYGRHWRMNILCTDGTYLTLENKAFSEEESMKVTFEINYPGYEGWYFSEFHIYNMNIETRRKIIGEGAEVYFYAGYNDGNFGQIFGGTVFQSLFTRENVTDYKLTLLCIDGNRLIKDNFVNFTLDKGYTDMTLLNETASRALNPIKMGLISSNINQGKHIRGASAFGKPAPIMREVVRTNSAQMYSSLGQVLISKAEDNVTGDSIIVNPDTGLIGTPTQIGQGISFRTLLNPLIILANPPRWVKLDMSAINIKIAKATPDPNAERVPLLPSDGYFKIGGVKHIGDTRGNDWYTDVVGYSLTGKAGLQLCF